MTRQHTIRDRRQSTMLEQPSRSVCTIESGEDLSRHGT